MKTIRLCPLVPLALVALGLVGCNEKTGVKEQTTVTSPEGKTTVTKETKIETSGDHPPATDARPNTDLPKNP